MGAATEASKEGIPAIAFSGTTGSQTGYTAPVQTYMTVYADLSTNVTQSLVASGKPYLPSDIWLNVNFPAVSGSTCSSPAEFKFVLSRINNATSGTAADVKTCGSTRLPTETTVVDTAGCYASISVGNAVAKTDANATEQAVVLEKLQSILSCLSWEALVVYYVNASSHQYIKGSNFPLVSHQNVLAQHQNAILSRRNNFWLTTCTSTSSTARLDLLKENNHETRNFSVGVVVVELRWVAIRDFLMFGGTPEFYTVPDDGIIQMIWCHWAAGARPLRSAMVTPPLGTMLFELRPIVSTVKIEMK